MHFAALCSYFGFISIKMLHRKQWSYSLLVQQLIGDIIDRMLESIKIPEPPLSHYLPPQDDELSIFPNLPPLVGNLLPSKNLMWMSVINLQRVTQF